MVARLIEEARGYAQGKQWKWRMLFLIYFAYVLVRYWVAPEYRCVISALNLGLHEFGHLVFWPFGQFLAVSGGTIMQLAAPVLGMFNFYRQEDFFSITLCCGWLSTSLFDAAPYIADARAMQLPLVSPFGGGDAAIHDWHYLLSRTGLLSFDTALGFLTRCAASCAMFACLGAGAWILWQMINAPSTQEGL